LRNRVRRAKQREQRNLVGPKQRGAGGRVREGREPKVGEPVGFCSGTSVVGSLQWDKCAAKWRGRLAYSISTKVAPANRCYVSSLTVARKCCRWRTG